MAPRATLRPIYGVASERNFTACLAVLDCDFRIAARGSPTLSASCREMAQCGPSANESAANAPCTNSLTIFFRSG